MREAIARYWDACVGLGTSQCCLCCRVKSDAHLSFPLRQVAGIGRFHGSKVLGQPTILGAGVGG